ncbi:MAG TPA: ABC transporter permease [Lysobacter sp.]|nr:ABC transporter permease [Lysobacter sp.]
MNALTVPTPSRWRCYRLEARNEFLRLLRSPSFAIPTLLFPPMFYLLFAVVLNRRGGPEVASYLLASYGVFGVMAPGLFGFGVGIALDRERGFLTLKRALPVPPGAIVGSRMVMAMLFAAAIALVLLTLGLTLGGVVLGARQAALLFAVELIGVLPFCALGLYVGSLVGGQGAPAVVNLIYLPMAFLSGLWIPLAMLPDVLATLAPLWPSHHVLQIALAAIGAPHDGRVALHVAVLLAYTAAFFLLAQRRLARA